MAIDERDHAVVEQVGRYRLFAITELGEGDLGVGVYELLVIIFTNLLVRLSTGTTSFDLSVVGRRLAAVSDHSTQPNLLTFVWRAEAGAVYRRNLNNILIFPPSRSSMKP